MTTESPVIQSTTNYSLFKQTKGNRRIAKNHVNALITSIAKSPQTIKLTPIIVNGNYEIIDGQHRLEALRQMNLPVYYIKEDNLSLSEALLNNSLRRAWTPLDYAYSWAEQGNPVYLEYLRLREEYGLNHTVALIFITQRDGREKFIQPFKEGALEIKDSATTEELARGFDSVADTVKHIPRRLLNVSPFATALLAASRHPHFMFSLLISQLETIPAREQVVLQHTVAEWKAELQRVFNYHLDPNLQISIVNKNDSV